MFEYDIQDLREIKRKTDKKSSYETFLKSIHQDINSFPFEVENKVPYKGGKNPYRIVSFGGYMAEDGWRVYICYRTVHNNQVMQYRWRWDAVNDEPFDEEFTAFQA